MVAAGWWLVTVEVCVVVSASVSEQLRSKARNIMTDLRVVQLF